MSCCERVHAVSEQSQSACPAGQRISHSTNDGFSLLFRHDPLRNHRRVVIAGTFDIAERSSRREIGRHIEDCTPCVKVAGAGW